MGKKDRITCLRCNGFIGCGGSRGNCATCYTHYWNEIKRGRATMEELEAQGKVLPSKHANRKTNTEQDA